MIENCKECGTPLENTPSGQFSACPKGHGKLHPRILIKPFDLLEVPRKVAVCPECGGTVKVECNEWTEVDGVSKPTQGGLLVYCAADSPFGDPDENEDEEEEHNYAQCMWMDAIMSVYKWLGAV
jgi:hypothetical protein